MAGRAQSSMPTQAAAMKDPQVLNPMVRSYSLNEYEQKRPNYVNPDHYAGQSWAYLGRSLDRFYGAWMKFSTDERDRYIERGIAKGTLQASHSREADGLEANKRNWKQLVESHPEYADDNPWVEVGYNQQRLKNIGSDMKVGLLEAMDKSGVYRSENHEEVHDFINSYIAKYRAEAGLDTEDAILMAKHFSPVEAQAREGAMSKYEGYRHSIRQGKLADEVSVTIGRILEDKSISVEDKIRAISAEQEGAFENGLLETHENRVKLSLNAVMGSFNRTQNRNILEMIKKIDIGNGMKLIETPEGAQYYQNTWNHLRAQDAEASRKAENQRRVAEEKRAKALGYEAYNAMKEGRISDIEEFFESKGLSPSTRADVLGSFMKLQGEEDRYRKWVHGRPSNVLAVEADITDIESTYENPVLGLELMYEKTGNKLYKDRADELKKMEAAGMKADNTARKASYKAGCTEAKDSINKVMNTHIVIGQNEVGLKTKNETKIAEVKRKMRPLIEKDFLELYGKEIAKLKAANGGKPLTDIDYQTCQETASIAVGDLAEKGKYLPKGFNPNDYILDVYDADAVNTLMAIDRPMTPDQMVTAVPVLNQKFNIPENIIRTVPVRDLVGILQQNNIGLDIIMDAFGKAGLIVR